MSDLEFKKKYLKYKTKYLQLKNIKSIKLFGGTISESDERLLNFLKIDRKLINDLKMVDVDYTDVVNNLINEQIYYDDERILNFQRNDSLTLPSWYRDISHNLLVAAGNGSSDYNEEGLNLETMPKYGWTIFCCIGYGVMSLGDELKKNLDYLKNNSSLKIILCIIDILDPIQLDKFINLFKYTIDNISTHDTRWYINEDKSYELLKIGGACWHNKNVIDKAGFNRPENINKWNCKLNGFTNKLTDRRDEFLIGKGKCVKV